LAGHFGDFGPIAFVFGEVFVHPEAYRIYTLTGMIGDGAKNLVFGFRYNADFLRELSGGFGIGVDGRPVFP
jgi:hypothetical protein